MADGSQSPPDPSQGQAVGTPSAPPQTLLGSCSSSSSSNNSPSRDPSEDLETSRVKAPTFDSLPPMPEPNHKAMQMESMCGSSLVIILTCIFVACVHSSLKGCDDLVVSASTCGTLFGLIYCEAAIALTCLLGLLFHNPGVIKRTPETCFPMPPQVSEYIQSGGCLESLANIASPSGESYCVRCLVWRPAPRRPVCRGPLGALQRRGLLRCSQATAHHCRTCARCVMNFDHHCGVFGRCIAGRGFGGNMGFFKTIIITGYAAGVTVFAAFGVSIASKL